MTALRVIALPMLALSAVLACSGAVSSEAAREAPVVTVGEAVLTGATLEKWLLEAPGQPSEAMATVLVSAFIEGAAVGEALRRSESFEDSATVAEAVLPDAIRGTILDFFAGRARAMPEPTDAEADSVARLGGTRAFQHILWRVDWEKNDTAFINARARSTQEIARRLEAGEDFAALAREVSEDSLSRQSGGYLNALQRSDLPESRFATAAWRLQPGEISGLVPSPAGLHILRRPPITEARSQFKAWLAPRLARRADSVWVDSLSQAKQVTIAADAPARLRAGAVEPLVFEGEAPMVTWEGGALAPAQVRRWVALLPPIERAGLANAADSVATLFLRELAQREIVYVMTTGGTELTPRAWEALAPQFRAAIATVREEMRPTVVNGDLSAAAIAYVEAVTTGGQRYRPMPGGMAGILRARSAVTVDREAINAIIAAALPVWMERRAADSAAVTGTVDSSSADSSMP
jgi:hypothetical protein